MDKERQLGHLNDLIPKSIDDIVRAHRDECRLAWATDAELDRLTRNLQQPDAMIRHALSDWNVLMIHLTLKESASSLPLLVGAEHDTRRLRITSAVMAVDFGAELVRTQNSLYRVVGPRDPQPDVHTLMHICVHLNDRGLGAYFGVPAFFY